MEVVVGREKGCLWAEWMCVGKSNTYILSANTIFFRAEIIGLLSSLETLPVQELALITSCKVVCTEAEVFYVLTPLFQCNLCG